MNQDFGSLFTNLPQLLEDYGHLYDDEDHARKEILKLYNQKDGDLTAVKQTLANYISGESMMPELASSTRLEESIRYAEQISDKNPRDKNQQLIDQALELWPDNLIAYNYQLFFDGESDVTMIIKMHRALENFKRKQSDLLDPAERYVYYQQAYYLAVRMVPIGLLSLAKDWFSEIAETEYADAYDIPFRLLVVSFLMNQEDNVEQFVHHFKANYEPSVAIDIVYLLQLIKTMRLEEAKHQLDLVIEQDPDFSLFFMEDSWNFIQIKLTMEKMRGPHSKPHYVAAYALQALGPFLIQDLFCFGWIQERLEVIDKRYYQTQEDYFNGPAPDEHEQEIFDLLSSILDESDSLLESNNELNLYDEDQFYMFLNYELGVRGTYIYDAGYRTIEQVNQASDEELLAIKGVGPATVKELRALLAISIQRFDI